MTDDTPRTGGGSEETVRSDGAGATESAEAFSGGIIPGWNRISYTRRKRLRHYGMNALTVVLLVVIVFPIFWMLSTSLRPQTALFARPAPLLPENPTLTHYRTLFENPDIARYFFNSLGVAAGMVTITTAAATLGGYGLTRIDIPYKRQAARFILFGYMFPSILLAIPMYIFWRQLGMINTYYGLILAETATALPFSLWLMWKFFQSVPYSLEESAQMAGATRFRAFYQVALPMAKPGITAVAVFSYALSWGAYTIPKIIIASERSKWPLTVGIDTLTQQHTVLWGQVMAASVIMVIPPLIFIFALQRVLLRGFRVGGI